MAQSSLCLCQIAMSAEVLGIEELFSKYEKDNSAAFYMSLIGKVSEHSVLTEWIKKRTKNDPRIMNTIASDWKTMLLNHPIFQEYVNGTVDYLKYESKANKAINNFRVRDYSKNINILVLGSFRVSNENGSDLNKQSKLKLVESVPLQFIGDVMALNFKKSILHNPAFYFNGCKGLCLKCRNYNVPDDNVWCIQEAIVYRGGHLQYALREYCASLFDTPSKAILHLEIHMGCTFGDKCKIGGTVKTVIFIDEIFNEANDSIVGILKKDMSTDDLKRKIEETDDLNEETVKNSRDSILSTPKGDLNEETVKNSHDSILSIPKKVRFVEPPTRSFQVNASVRSMPPSNVE